MSEQPYGTLPDEVMVSLISRDIGVTITAGDNCPREDMLRLAAYVVTKLAEYEEAQ
jgi:hypothetical protein